MRVHNVGKAYRTYRSEWQRIARWFGLPTNPSGEHWVLRHVSFDIRNGEAIGIIGQNGAGKSTLLKMITRTLEPTEGDIQVNGCIAAILELGMGFNPELTGRKNVFHAAGLMGFTIEQIQQIMPGVEAFAEIGEYFDQPVRTYSSGMQSRLAFSVATAFKPDLLILDEVLSVGDAYFQAKCYDRIASYKTQGMALMLVTHSVEDIVRHCDRALFIHAGQLVKDGSPREVTNFYLDTLFGKRTKSEKVVAVAEESLPLEFMEGTQDLFHTRPGYRKEEHRWGQGGAVILDYLIVSEGQRYPHQIASNTMVEFSFKVRFDQSFDNVVPGFLVKTLEGIFLYGTNSFICSQGNKSISASVGDVIVFKFSLPISLNGGYYLVSFGISSGDPLQHLTPLERRYDAVLINVQRPVQFWGMIDLQASFEFSYAETHV